MRGSVEKIIVRQSHREKMQRRCKDGGDRKNNDGGKRFVGMVEEKHLESLGLFSFTVTDARYLLNNAIVSPRMCA